jgi:hypothetical protein
VKAARCSRPLADQATDESGSRRRSDHELRRLDLLSDEELDAFRARHGTDALDAADELARAMEVHTAKIDEAMRVALESRIPARPILTIVVCFECGAYEVARMKRAWPIDRAMLRSGLAERDVLALLALLIEAGGEPDLDALDAERLRELHALVGEDVDLESIRERYVG